MIRYLPKKNIVNFMDAIYLQNKVFFWYFFLIQIFKIIYGLYENFISNKKNSKVIL